MKNECDIVRDLLFSYNDGVLSETSKALVEEHLKTCETCNNVLEEIKLENETKKPSKEIDIFKSIRKKITKRNIIILISLLFLLLVIIFNILVFRNYNEIASTMEIYLQDDITEEQIENIKNRIIEKSDKIELEYISKEKALERMKDTFADNPDLLSGYNNENNPMPASIEIKTNTEIQKIVDSIQDMPGITKIETHINYNPYQLFLFKIFNK